MVKMKFMLKIIAVLSILQQLPAENLPVDMLNELKGTPTAQARDRRRKFNSEGNSKKSDLKFGYFLKSLALPGWGEYELGSKGSAYAFITAEALLVTAAAGLYYFSTERTDDYQNYATLHAGVNKSGKNDGYWINIGNYDNTAQYNEQKNIDRNFAARYDLASEQWQWDNSGNRKSYDKIRIEAENLETLSYYTIGAVFANHLLSAMNASFIAGSLNLEVKPEVSGITNPEGKLAVSWYLP